MISHRKYCERALERFKDTQDAFVAERMAKDCLTVPPNEASLVAANRLASTAVKLSPTSHFTQFVNGLAEYRQAHFEKAIDQMEKVLPMRKNSPNHYAQAWAVLALARHRLKENAKALEAVEEAEKAVERGAPDAAKGDLGPDLIDWIFAQALLKEASAALQPLQQAKGDAAAR